MSVRVEFLESCESLVGFESYVGLDMDSTILAFLELTVAIVALVLPHVHVVLEFNLRVIMSD